jgi:hypothetical protein
MTEDIKSRDGDVSVDAIKRRRIVNQGVFDRPYMDRGKAKGKALKALWKSGLPHTF